jgi:hypothetical protein
MTASNDLYLSMEIGAPKQQLAFGDAEGEFIVGLTISAEVDVRADDPFANFRNESMRTFGTGYVAVA